MKKKPLSKRQLYWMALQTVVESQITLRLDNVSSMKESMWSFHEAQTLLKTEQRAWKNQEIFAFVIGESWIEKVIEALSSNEPLWLRVDPDVERFLDYVYNKLHHLCLHEFTITAPEITVHKLLFYYEDQLRQAHESYQPRTH